MSEALNGPLNRGNRAARPNTPQAMAIAISAVLGAGGFLVHGGERSGTKAKAGKDRAAKKAERQARKRARRAR